MLSYLEFMASGPEFEVISCIADPVTFTDMQYYMSTKYTCTHINVPHMHTIRITQRSL